VDQDILVVKFNDSGLVEDVTHKGDEERRNISISAESTPTEGNQITILEQLLGNLGRYNGPK
jgi:outer membrane protein assembly factor BamE (lipoprotein component of BamABCDE complex)